MNYDYKMLTDKELLAQQEEALKSEKKKLWTRIQEFQKRVEIHEQLAQNLKVKSDELQKKGIPIHSQ